MSSPRRPLQLLAALPLFLTLTACPHPQTLSSLARTERPKLPTPAPDLTRAEHLTPLSGRKPGEMVLVDKAWAADVTQRLGEAAGAVARGNNRAAGNKLIYRCIAAIMATGKAPAGCPSTESPTR